MKKGEKIVKIVIISFVTNNFLKLTAINFLSMFLITFNHQDLFLDEIYYYL